MSKIFSEDAYCLGLLYAYMFSRRKMVLKEDLDKFYKEVKNNLSESNAMDMYATMWYDNDPSIYYPCRGKNGEIYYVLYPDFDIERAKSKYIGCLSTEVFVASQKENALNSLDLESVDGKIIPKKNINAGISDGTTFMSQFIQQLKSGELKIETLSQIETNEDLTKDFIIEQLESYQKLLNSGIIEEATKKEKMLVKKSTTNKN